MPSPSAPDTYAGSPSDVRGDVHLHVRRMDRRTFDAGAPLPQEHQDALGVFLADLVRPYGLAADGDLAGGQSYGEMAAELIGALVGGHEPVDLLVLAFAIPDLRPGRATATYLSHLCPGGPLAFAVCDQGSAAAFTGLRLAREYLRTGGCRRALVLVVEQAVLPYPATAGAAVPQRHAAVGLLCERTGPARLHTLEQHPNVSAGQAADLLARAVREAGDGVRLVLGGGLDSGDLPAARTAPPGQPHTGAWWGLAAEPEGARVLVADYDPQLRYLCLAGFGAASADVAGVQAGRQ